MGVKGNIFLIGPMGVGKSTIGRVLAHIMNLRFFDSDQEIEANTGADIPWIFDVEGESGFRERERKMIIQLCKRKDIVLATGGGVILAKQNREALCSNGTVVYLTAPIEKLVDRTRKDKNRPLLRTNDPERKIIELCNARNHLYEDTADIVIDTEGKKPQVVASEIQKLVQKIGGKFIREIDE
tara:strand:- start:76 stop:624 length:549 start_codon:yes stop_codon:yes gene_type:complete